VLPLTGDTLMSEVKRNVWTEVLPDGMRRAPLVFITRWVIHKDNHDKLAEHVTGSIGSWGMDAQQTHPDRLFYSGPRHFFRGSRPKGPGYRPLSPLDQACQVRRIGRVNSLTSRPRSPQSRSAAHSKTTARPRRALVEGRGRGRD